MKKLASMFFGITVVTMLILVLIEKHNYEKTGELSTLENVYTWLEDEQAYSVSDDDSAIIRIGHYHIDIPDEFNSRPIIRITAGAFGDILGEKQIVIPAYVQDIGNGAFANCTDVLSIFISSSVTNIGSSAFFGCDSLQSIEIPSTVTNIGLSAFAGCDNLSEITVSPDNMYYHSSNNCLIDTIGKTLRLGCENSIIPDDGSVTAIAQSAFRDNSPKDVFIPNTVRFIGSKSFSSSKLETITMSSSVIFIDDEAFSENKDVTIYAPRNSYAEQWALDRAYKLNYVDDYCENIGKPVETYNLLFSMLDDETYSIFHASEEISGNIILPERYQGILVTAITMNAFYGCKHIESVEMLSPIKNIPGGAFKYCTNLKRISCSNTLESIEANAFCGCISLEEVALPKTLTYIEEYAFNSCPKDMIIYVPKGSYAETWARNEGYNVQYIE